MNAFTFFGFCGVVGGRISEKPAFNFGAVVAYFVQVAREFRRKPVCAVYVFCSSARYGMQKPPPVGMIAQRKAVVEVLTTAHAPDLGPARNAGFFAGRSWRRGVFGP